MKNLFVLMALAGLAAFQVGCGGESSTPVAKPPAGGPAGMAPPATPGMAGATPAAAADADKKDGEGDKKDAEPAATEDKPTEEKPADEKAEEKPEEK
jgi:hypothetical protein